MNMVKIKTAELEGAALDWAVADALGYSEGTDAWCDPAWMDGDKFIQSKNKFRPSTDWSQGGGLISIYRVSIIYCDEECDPCAWTDDTSAWHGPTHLIAACRAIVASKLGDVVEVPGELVG